MMFRRYSWIVALTLAATLGPVTQAHAELWRNVVRGLQVFDTQFSGEKNLLTNGWTLNSSAFYNQRNFDMGLADLTLTGSTVGSIGYGLRPIPSLNFSYSTRGTPLAYTFNTKTGLQDVQVNGNILINISTDINLLGFYDTTIQISNRGTTQVKGSAISDIQPIDYDIGPINLSGNIFVDALAMLTQPAVVSSDAVSPFAKFSAKTTKVAALNKNADDLRTRIAAGEVLSDEDIANLVNSTLLSGLIEGNAVEEILNGFPLPPELLKMPQADVNNLFASASPLNIPEPTTLALLSLGLVALNRRRR